ncbi:hypothetical protein [Piscirickettsia litoralis]|uniref:Phage protein n=1 Tax=Piscirickettsia litoralis TaxID=1891921 RepID=A0ABX3A3Q4_9GAMM|nr:hypothetical protein [Piscirickettsia litoralis]ODN41990.1 hypothetical protein BGC07_02220 [Piscirickettsia litoralis]
MPFNNAKISNSIRQATSWLEENKPSWYNPLHRKHNFDKELSALKTLEDENMGWTYTDKGVQECIKETGYHKHSFISFLHDNGVEIKDQQVGSTVYTSMDSTLFFQKTTEERKAIYDKVLDL